MRRQASSAPGAHSVLQAFRHMRSAEQPSPPDTGTIPTIKSTSLLFEITTAHDNLQLHILISSQLCTRVRQQVKTNEPTLSVIWQSSNKGEVTQFVYFLLPCQILRFAIALDKYIVLQWLCIGTA